jgi:cupin fold WbuC family metalloprotein
MFPLLININITTPGVAESTPGVFSCQHSEVEFGNRLLQAQPMQAIQTFQADLVQTLIARARASERLRTNHNFHATLDENPHRFLNVMLRGSYFTPHRHLKPPKHESFLVLKGEVGFLLFDDAGRVNRAQRMRPDALDLNNGAVVGVDVQPGIWHSLVVLSDVAVCYEVKPGPYDPTSDKEFADWAPHEGQPGCSAYLCGLLQHFENP